MMKVIDKLKDGLLHRFLDRLELVDEAYEYRVFNNTARLFEHIRPGDIVLVEGNTELSRIIKLFSNSHWSHAAMYVGDALVSENTAQREYYLERFGDDANHLLIEAFAGQGVIATPLIRYESSNIRVCRPYDIDPEDLKIVIRQVIANLGKRYDRQNIIDIAIALLPGWMNPFKKRSLQACLGSCNDFQVMCSGMIAKAFQSVGFPVVPILRNEKQTVGSPYGQILSKRHYSQILPRDYDLSPNFQIIKFNIIENGRFDYKKLVWKNDLTLNES